MNLCGSCAFFVRHKHYGERGVCAHDRHPSRRKEGDGKYCINHSPRPAEPSDTGDGSTARDTPLSDRSGADLLSRARELGRAWKTRQAWELLLEWAEGAEERLRAFRENER